MRVAVVDIGTNSTRLLLAEVGESVRELERRTSVTRLGEGLEATGELAEAAMERVHATLDEYDVAIAACAAEARIAVLTSAVRDAANGEAFVAAVRARHELDARVIPGSEEAQLTFLGAMSDRDPAEHVPTVVIDVGGGSTELILGEGREVRFSVSLQAGVVRHSERHLREDPPTPEQLQALREDVASLIELGLPGGVRRAARRAIAVAGTATSAAAIDLRLDPYDATRVHGHAVDRSTLEAMLARLASVPLAERRRTTGLHPDRAPTIVAGVAILIEVLEALALDAFEASEHDILRGAAIARAARG